MAKAKPIKQKKENKFLQKIIFFFKTLFSNNTCIDGREHKWYGQVIIAILAAVIATIPTMVGRFTIQASSFFTSGYTYDYENALTAFADQTSSVSMKISSGSLTVDETAWNSACKTSMEKTPLSGREDIPTFWGYFYKVPVTVSTSTSEDTTTVTSTIDKWYCGLAIYYSGDENPTTYASTKLSNYLNDPNYQLENIIGLVVAEAKEWGDFPVIAAGGIWDKNDIELMLSLGASGVQMGTRFIGTFECDASDDFKQILINSKKEDIKLIKSPVGYPARAIKTNLLALVDKRQGPKINCISNCVSPCGRGKEASKVGYCIADRLFDAYYGAKNTGLFFSGANGYKLDRLISVKELIRKLINGE